VKIFQKGFNVSQDGPGNRLVFHLFGCNMRCPWCANPEGLFGVPVEISDREIVRLCIESRPLFYGGGGATFTGGEPTAQFQSLQKVLTALKKSGINTALETNGTNKKLPLLFPLVDHLYIDCKHTDDGVHRAQTGVSNAITLQNIAAAAKKHQGLTVRIPLINGFNTDQRSLNDFIGFLSPLGIEAELLAYHEFGKHKWKNFGREYTVDNGTVDSDILTKFKTEIHSNGIKTVST